jgi:hypothetical protein
MDLLALRLGPLLPAPPHRRRVLRNRFQGRIVASNATNPVRDGGAAAVVWFKHDLRIDDHPGLAAAVAEPRRPVVPLYVFDRRILAGMLLPCLLVLVLHVRSGLTLEEWDLGGSARGVIAAVPSCLCGSLTDCSSCYFCSVSVHPSLWQLGV